jgi:2-(1,2-epoxy-1,2-dihydrophenyl)acetyl-CoA isomerase
VSGHDDHHEAAVDGLVLRREDAILWIRLARPEHKNRMNDTMRERLRTVLREADRDHAVRAIVVTGTDQWFMTGADIRVTEHARAVAASEGHAKPERPPLIDARSTVAGYCELYKTYWELETPVVAAVNGTVSAAGLPLAFGADLIVAASGARFASLWSEGGMSAHAADPYILPRVFPLPRLMEFSLLGRRYTAEDMLAWNVINAVVAPSALEATAREWAIALATGPTLSMGQTKRLYRRSLDSDMLTSFAEEAAAVVMLSPSSDRKEGMQALAQGRRPMFIGR